MIDDLTMLLRRELDALVGVERRLVALELLLAAGEARFLSLAVDEATSAMDRLSAIELMRGIGLTAAGVDADVTLEQLVARAPAGSAAVLSGLAGELRAAAGRVAVRRERIRGVVEGALDDGRVTSDRVRAAASVAEVLPSRAPG